MEEMISRLSAILGLFRSVTIDTKMSFKTSSAPSMKMGGLNAGGSPSETAPADSAPSIFP
ncbi:MAG TPA: hypothetical protein DD658_06985 [Deltaproteobacteria bacterium]|nr:hypothetical protein [Deltaproteobacteria bacterium]